ncbi:MAG: hypothetical protein ACXWID_06705 [Pyrinomonadaceae bacterium]
MTANRTKLLGLGIILAHLGISVFHGVAHQGAMVALTTFGSVYVLVVITLAPLVAGALLFTRWARIGALLLALSMLGSLAFGGWYHFLSATNDHVSQVHGPWRSTFLWTAIVLAVSELVGVMIGISAFRAIQDPAE